MINFRRKKILLGRDTRGISLVELLVSVSAVIIATLGILTLVNRSLGLNRVNADSHTGTYLAAEGIELVKNFFDKSFLLALLAAPGSGDYYGWGAVPGGIPVGIYKVDYEDTLLESISCPQQYSVGSPPTPAVIEDIFSECMDVDGLYLSSSGYFSYTSSPGSEQTRFERIIIIDDPYLGAGDDLDYRVTSAVGWESRGGTYVVQLQDHFLPWRIP